MERLARFGTAALAALLFLWIAAAAAAAERSGCVACHLDEAMLKKNLSPTQVEMSALQSGTG
jgi:cytochrome c551/c552